MFAIAGFALLSIPLFMWLHHNTTGERDCKAVGTCVYVRPSRLSLDADDQPPTAITDEEDATIPLTTETFVELLLPDANLGSETRTPQPLQQRAKPVTTAPKATPKGTVAPRKRVAPHQNPQIAKPPPKALFQRLVHDRCGADVTWNRAVEIGLKNWVTSGISQQQIDELCVRKAAHINLIGSKAELRYGQWNLGNMNIHRLASAVWLLQLTAERALARADPLPDVDMMFQPGDGSFSTAAPSQQWDNAGPLMSNVKCGEDASVSFPFTYAVRTASLPKT